MFIALSTVTALLLISCLMPLVRHPHWVFRSMEFPRLQLVVVAAGLVIADLTMLDFRLPGSWVLVGLASGCLLWQLWWILPYTLLWPVEVKSAEESSVGTMALERRLKVLSSNVLGSNRNAQALLEIIDKRQPDIVVTLESDQWWQDQLDALLPQMPHSIKCPRDNLYGMHVYSKLPLQSVEIAYLVEEDKPSMHALVTLRSGDKVTMHFLHPAPPSPTENTEATARDAELVIVARSVSDGKGPVIVVGDLNDVAWSSTTRLFRKLSGLLDPRVGRGMFNTFHADYPFLRWPLDHLFHSTHFTIGAIERLPPIGSDHFALLAELWLTPSAGRDQEGLEADQADLDRGQTVVATEGVSPAEVPRPAA